MKIDSNARYLETHEWARKEGDVFVLGISDYAQSTLSDIVYVELHEVGDTVTKGEQFGVVESVKVAADVYAPLSGEVVAINTELENAPELINSEAFEGGWLLKISVADLEEWETLLTPEAYAELLEKEA